MKNTPQLRGVFRNFSYMGILTRQKNKAYNIVILFQLILLEMFKMYVQILKDFMDSLTEWKIPGNTLIVNYKGTEVFRYSSGFSDVKIGKKMQGNEWFNVYSCSKPVTCVAALQLFEKGFFRLDDPIYSFLPEFKEVCVECEDHSVRKAEKAITFRHLFTMSAGLTYNVDQGSMKRLQEECPDADTRTVAKYIAGDLLRFDPGTKYRYSVCHDVLAAIVEVISGMNFGDYVKKNIFAPLGFENQVTFKRTAEIYKKMATHYAFATSDEKGVISSPDGQAFWKEIEKTPWLVLTKNHESGGAGMVSTADAYAAFAKAMANWGKCPNGEGLLSPDTINLMRTPHGIPGARKEFDSTPRQRGYDYGLGVRTLVDIESSGGYGCPLEFGWAGADGCYTLFDPDNELSLFYAQHILYGDVSDYIEPEMRKIIYKYIVK